MKAGTEARPTIIIPTMIMVIGGKGRPWPLQMFLVQGARMTEKIVFEID